MGAFEAFANDEYMSEVYIGATKAEQAKIKVVLIRQGEYEHEDQGFFF